MVEVNEMKSTKSQSERAGSFFFFSCGDNSSIEASQSHCRNIMLMSTQWGAHSLAQYQQRHSRHIFGFRCGGIKGQRCD